MTILLATLEPSQVTQVPAELVNRFSVASYRKSSPVLLQYTDVEAMLINKDEISYSKLDEHLRSEGQTRKRNKKERRTS